MTDLDLFKSIVRATTGVSAENVPAAVAKVRALFAQSAAPSAPPEVPKSAPKGRNRMYLGGVERVGGDDAA